VAILPPLGAQVNGIDASPVLAGGDDSVL